MGHIQKIDADFRALWDEGDEEKAVKWVKERVLESYRNGLKGREAKTEKKKAPRRNGRSKAANDQSEE